LNLWCAFYGELCACFYMGDFVSFDSVGC
jgi:hypothetical protein